MSVRHFLDLSDAGGDALALVADPNAGGIVTVNTIYEAAGYGSMPDPAISAGGPTINPAEEGVHLLFTYTSVGSMDGGSLRFVPPTGWTAPQGSTSVISAGVEVETGSAGWTTIDATTTATTLGIIEMAGDGSAVVPITSMSAGQTIVLNYGKGGGAAGASGTNVAGASEFLVQSQSHSAGVLTTLSAASVDGSLPSVTVVNAADGSGTFVTTGLEVAAGSTGNVLSSTYTAVGTVDGGNLTYSDPASPGMPDMTADNVTITSSGTLGTVDF